MDNASTPVQIGHSVRRAITAADVDLDAIAKSSHMSSTDLESRLDGTPELTFGNLVDIADALDIPTSKLLETR